MRVFLLETGGTRTLCRYQPWRWRMVSVRGIQGGGMVRPNDLQGFIVGELEIRFKTDRCRYSDRLEEKQDR